MKAEAELALRVARQYRIVEVSEPRGPWKVQAAAYSHVADLGDQELLAYRWQRSEADAAAHRVEHRARRLKPGLPTCCAGERGLL